MKKFDKKQIPMLVLGLSIVACLVVHIFVRTPMQEDLLLIEAAVKLEKEELARLKEHEAQLQFYLTSIEENRLLVDSIMDIYPEEVLSEGQIIFADHLQDDVGITVTNAAFQPFKSLNRFNITRFIDDVDTRVPVSAYLATTTYQGAFTYPQLKSMIDYTQSDAYRTVIDTLNISYDGGSGELTGTMVVNKYFLTTSEYVYDPTVIPPIESGTTNPFGTITTTETVIETED